MRKDNATMLKIKQLQNTFFSEVEKESKKKHIWARVTLPNRNSP